MIRIKVKGDDKPVSVPDNEALVNYMNMTSDSPCSTAHRYMLEFAHRAVTTRNIDIRATDFDSFVEDLSKYGYITRLE